MWVCFCVQETNGVNGVDSSVLVRVRVGEVKKAI